MTTNTEISLFRKGVAEAIEKTGNSAMGYVRIDAGIAELKQRYGGVVFPVATSKGMDEAKAARLAIREPRYAVESIRKEAKSPILELGKLIDGEAKRITAELLAIEEPIDQQIKTEEARKEAERAEKARIEAERVAAIHKKIACIQCTPDRLQRAGSAELRAEIARLDAQQFTADEFGEFADKAEQSRQEVVSELVAQLDAQQKMEALAAQQKAEQEAEAARLAEARAELIRQQKIEAERLAAERAELEKQRAAQAEAERTAKAELDAQREKVAAENAALQARMAALEAMETAAKPVAPTPTPAPIVEAAPVYQAIADTNASPSSERIINAIAAAFNVSPQKALVYLQAYKWEFFEVDELETA